jgi:hypothetical protein
MPFDFDQYKKECKNMSDAQLQRQKQHYTRVAASCVAGSSGGGALAIFTLGLSLVGSAASIIAAANAGGKLDIIDAEMAARRHYSRTRGRDVAAGLVIGAGTTLLGAGVGHGVGVVIGQGALTTTDQVFRYSVGVVAERGADFAVDKLGTRGS